MKKTLKRIFSVLGSLLLVALVVLVALLLVARMQNRPLFIARRSLLWIVTGSMEPTIPAETYILVEKIDPEEVAVGDVITFYSDDPALGGGLNTHRVVAVNDDGTFVTRGDNPSIYVADAYPVRRAAVVGRYVRMCPLLSRCMRFLHAGAGLIIVSLCFLLMIGNYLLPRLAKKKQSPTREELIEAAVAQEIERLRAEAAARDRGDPPPPTDSPENPS